MGLWAVTIFPTTQWYHRPRPVGDLSQKSGKAASELSILLLPPTNTKGNKYTNQDTTNFSKMWLPMDTTG